MIANLMIDTVTVLAIGFASWVLSIVEINNYRRLKMNNSEVSGRLRGWVNRKNKSHFANPGDCLEGTEMLLFYSYRRGHYTGNCMKDLEDFVLQYIAHREVEGCLKQVRKF